MGVWGVSSAVVDLQQISGSCDAELYWFTASVQLSQAAPRSRMCTATATLRSTESTYGLNYVRVFRNFFPVKRNVSTLKCKATFGQWPAWE